MIRLVHHHLPRFSARSRAINVRGFACLMRVGLNIALLFGCVSPAFAGKMDFSRPTETFSENSQLPPLLQEIAQHQYADAAARLHALLREHGDELMSTQSGGLISVTTWFDLLDPQAKAAVTPEYRTHFDAEARDALDAVRRNPGYGVEDLYVVARRYPLSQAAGQALALAGDRAMENGDAPAGLTLYTQAERAGWPMEEPQARRLAAVKRLGEGKLLDAPVGTAAAKPQAAAGAIPFDAPWYGAAGAFAQARFFPLTAEDDALLIGPRNVMRVRGAGAPAWSWSAAAPPAGPIVLPPVPTHHGQPELATEPQRRGSLYAGALLTDLYGRAQILVARQPTERSDQFTLRAFRVSDGRLMWDTQSQPDLHDQSIAGTPTVCGRYTYAVSLTVNTTMDTKRGGTQSATLSLLALDTATGQLLWQCPVGSYTSGRFKKGHEPEAGAWIEAWEQSEPAVAGDAVYLTPTSGIAVCIGRFDGKIRWLRPYGPVPTLDEMRDARARARLAAQNAAAPDPRLAVRFRGTPAISGNVVVIAPFDTLAAYGFDRSSGQQLWENAELAGATVIGATPAAVLLQGSSVIAIDPRTGRTMWSWEPKPGVITGPAVLRTTPENMTLLVPTTAGVAALNAADGVRLKQIPPVLNFRSFTQSEAGKKALETLNAVKAFGPPQ